MKYFMNYSSFAGKFCEIEPMVAHLYPQTSPCQQVNLVEDKTGLIISLIDPLISH